MFAVLLDVMILNLQNGAPLVLYILQSIGATLLALGLSINGHATSIKCPIIK